jgi:hypothetical protein
VGLGCHLDLLSANLKLGRDDCQSQYEKESEMRGFVLGESESGLEPRAVGARIWVRGRRSTGRSACAT